MTAPVTLYKFLRQQTRVVVANGTSSWTGQIIAIADTPSILLESKDGERTVLPQSFIVAAEATLRAPRIEEPGWDGKVAAHTAKNGARREFIRFFSGSGGTTRGWYDSGNYGAECWVNLIDPVLIRAGVS